MDVNNRTLNYGIVAIVLGVLATVLILTLWGAGMMATWNCW